MSLVETRGVWSGGVWTRTDISEIKEEGSSGKSQS